MSSPEVTIWYEDDGIKHFSWPAGWPAPRVGDSIALPEEGYEAEVISVLWEPRTGMVTVNADV